MVSVKQRNDLALSGCTPEPLMAYLKAADDGERMRLAGLVRERTRAAPEQMARYCLLSWEQAREMERSGLVSFGGHTRSHPILARAPLAKARSEIEGCRQDLQRELGEGTRHFAYPNGEQTDFNENVKALVRQTGFASAVCARRGTCGQGDDLYELRRIAVDGSFSNNETVTVRVRIEYIDNVISSPVVRTFTSSGAVWLSDDDMMQLFPSQSIIWAILVDAKSSAGSTDVVVTVSGYGTAG